MSPYDDPDAARAFHALDMEEECAAHQPPLNAGDGGNKPSPGSTHLFTIGTLSKGSTPSAGSDTASGSRGLSSPPASGGSPAK